MLRTTTLTDTSLFFQLCMTLYDCKSPDSPLFGILLLSIVSPSSSCSSLGSSDPLSLKVSNFSRSYCHSLSHLSFLFHPLHVFDNYNPCHSETTESSYIKITMKWFKNSYLREKKDFFNGTNIFLSGSEKSRQWRQCLHCFLLRG